VEQRSELVDVVTRLAKEEAAAEKGAAAAAKADAASGTAAVAADKPDLALGQAASKRNAAAALKQVHLLEQPVLVWQTLAQTTFCCFILPVQRCDAQDAMELRILHLDTGSQAFDVVHDVDTVVSNHAYTCLLCSKRQCRSTAEDNA